MNWELIATGAIGVAILIWIVMTLLNMKFFEGKISEKYAKYGHKVNAIRIHSIRADRTKKGALIINATVLYDGEFEGTQDFYYDPDKVEIL